MQQHFRTCNLCEAMCGLVIEHEDGQVKSIKGDKEDPFSKGFICPKAVALQDIYNDPDRLKKPLKKENGDWKEISWDQAFDEVSEKLKQIKDKHGSDALAMYQGNPTVHNYGSMLFSRKLSDALRIKNKFSASSVDQLPHHMTSQFMFGHSLLIPIPDIDRTQYFLVMGANPLVSNGSIMTAAGMPKRIKALQERGGKMVVIDPRKSETAAKADEHYYIKPGADALMLLGMLNVVFEQNLTDLKLSDHVKGFDEVKNLVKEFKPEYVEQLTGFKAEDIIKIAKDFCKASSAVCYGRMGLSTQEYGSLCQWLGNLLNIVTGNFDSPGGALFNTPALDIVKSTGPKGTYRKFNRWQSKVRKLPEFNGELPSAVIAEEILDAGDHGIKAMITSAGNPVLSTPNGSRLDEAFRQLDFMVSIDIYLNETTRHADYILPPTTGLETDQYDIIFNLFAVRNVAKYSEALFPPSEGAKHDWEIFKSLGDRIAPSGSGIASAMENFKTPQRILDMGLRIGPYGHFKKGLTLKKLKKNPHGIDFGPLKPSVPGRLFTVDQKIDLAPELFVGDLKRLKNNIKDGAKENAGFDLSLIGRRHLRSNNSWMHNSERLVKGGDRCTLLMNPLDAEKRGLGDKQKIEVASRVGAVQVVLQVSEEVMPGVVSLPHGWGHNRKGLGIKVAAEHAGESINDLTDHLLIDELTGNAAFSGVPVSVTSLEESNGNE